MRLCRHWPGEGAARRCLPLFPQHCACFSGSFSHSSRLDWIFIFPTRSLCLNIDHSLQAEQSTQTLCCSLSLRGGLNCRGLVLKAGSFRSLGHTAQMEMQIVGLPNTPQCIKACALPQLAQSCSCWINEAGSRRRGLCQSKVQLLLHIPRNDFLGWSQA